MKASIVALSEIEIPTQMFAVVTHDASSEANGTILAMFAYADHATRWGNDNYANRFKVVEVRL
ncbi:MAG TPA: hypothetical protein VHG72_21800 [Polyangia bacterium]|nr:hypothetical protein [Polyangia bacterium]